MPSSSGTGRARRCRALARPDVVLVGRRLRGGVAGDGDGAGDESAGDDAQCLAAVLGELDMTPPLDRFGPPVATSRCGALRPGGRDPVEIRPKSRLTHPMLRIYARRTEVVPRIRRSDQGSRARRGRGRRAVAAARRAEAARGPRAAGAERRAHRLRRPAHRRALGRRRAAGDRGEDGPALRLAAAQAAGRDDGCRDRDARPRLRAAHRSRRRRRRALRARSSPRRPRTATAGPRRSGARALARSAAAATCSTSRSRRPRRAARGAPSRRASSCRSRATCAPAATSR